MDKIEVTRFVARFMQAEKSGMTYKELAKTLGRSYGYVYQKAYNLRKAGVKLPALTGIPGGSHRVNVAQLNKFIAEFKKNNK